MLTLITNPLSPYCYANDRVLEKIAPTLDDHDIFIMPYEIHPNDEEVTYYQQLKESFPDILDDLKSYEIDLPKLYKSENISSSDLVYNTYYYLREFNLGLKFYQEVTKRFFQSSLNYNNLDQLGDIIEELGHSKLQYLRSIKSQAYEIMRTENLMIIKEKEIEGAPTFMLEDKIISLQKAWDTLEQKK